MNSELKTQFFSVVVPLYNKRPYIRRTINSILSQTFKDFELIGVDDGSTDQGAETLADIQDGRLNIVHQGNKRGWSRTQHWYVHGYRHLDCLDRCG